jgi:hypothetical protein
VADDLIHGVGDDVTAENEKTASLELSMARMRSIFETTYLYQGLMPPDAFCSTQIQPRWRGSRHGWRM